MQNGNENQNTNIKPNLWRWRTVTGLFLLMTVLFCLYLWWLQSIDQNQQIGQRGSSAETSAEKAKIDSLNKNIDDLKVRVEKVETQSQQTVGTDPSSLQGGTAGAGTQSAQGTQGLQGQAGPSGARGAQGLQGPAGSQGSQGAQGIQGVPGPAGTASCPNGDCISLQATSPGTQELGNLNISGSGVYGGSVTAATISGTTGINTGAGAGTQRIDASGNLVNIGTISSGLINGQTISSAANFTGTVAVTDDLAINGGDITTTAGTASLFNTNASTINIGGAATGVINIGPGGGTAGTVSLGGGAGATGCSMDGVFGNFTCSGI